MHWRTKGERVKSGRNAIEPHPRDARSRVSPTNPNTLVDDTPRLQRSCGVWTSAGNHGPQELAPAFEPELGLIALDSCWSIGPIKGNAPSIAEATCWKIFCNS